MKTPVSILIKDREYQGFIYNFSTTGMAVFCNEMLPVGEKAKITIVTPKQWGTIQCTIIWAQDVPTSGKVISQNPAIFRAGFEFNLESEEEKKFVEHLNGFL